MVTGPEIRAEHEAAIASLTPAQAAAVVRMTTSSTMANFDPSTRDLRLDRLCEFEAVARNAQAAEEPS